MGLETALFAGSALLGTGVAAKGLIDQKRGAKAEDRALASKAAADKQVVQANIRAEELRRTQMNLDAMRARRQAIRESQVARATAVSRGVGAGLQAREGQQSTSTQGAISQVASGVAGAIGAINQNETIGSGIFDANYDAFVAGSLASSFGTEANRARSRIDQGRALTSLGQSIFNASPQFANIGTSLFKPSNSQNVG